MALKNPFTTAILAITPLRSHVNNMKNPNMTPGVLLL